MTIDEIMKLVNAGFTKSEIMAMTAPAKDPAAAMPEKTEDPAPAEPVKPEEPAAAPATDPGEDITKYIDNKFEAMEKSLKDVIKSANIFSIGDIKPVTDITDIITKFFEEE